MAPTTPKHLQRLGLNFIPRCAGTSRHERLVRKHVPDYDPGCPLQSTSMPALHRRNVPNCRPVADGGMRKCSAGACPPQGSGWGAAESAVPILCTTPQFRLFIPWCAGAPAGMSDCYKTCPGLRSGIDTCHPTRHSSEGWNPDRVGRGETTRRWKKPHGVPLISSSHAAFARPW